MDSVIKIRNLECYLLMRWLIIIQWTNVFHIFIHAHNKDPFSQAVVDECLVLSYTANSLIHHVYANSRDLSAA